MTRYTYGGGEKVCFSHYLDVTDPEHVTTLVAEHGKTYEIKQADSPRLIQPDGQLTEQELAMPPDADWTETDEPTWAEVEAKEAEEAAKAPEQAPPPTPEPAVTPPARVRKKENG